MLPDEILYDTSLIAEFCSFAIESIGEDEIQSLINTLMHRFKMNDIKLNVYNKSIPRIQDEQKRLTAMIDNLQLTIKN